MFIRIPGRILKMDKHRIRKNKSDRYYFKSIMTQVFYVTAYQSRPGSLEYLESPVDVDKTTIVTKMLKFIFYVKSDEYMLPYINEHHYYFIYLYDNKYSHFQFYICHKN